MIISLVACGYFNNTQYKNLLSVGWLMVTHFVNFVVTSIKDIVHYKDGIRKNDKLFM